MLVRSSPPIVTAITITITTMMTAGSLEAEAAERVRTERSAGM